MSSNPLAKLKDIEKKTSHSNWEDKANNKISSLGKKETPKPIPIKKVSTPAKVSVPKKIPREVFGCRVYKNFISKNFDIDFKDLKLDLIKSEKIADPNDFLTGDYLMFVLAFANKYNLKDLFTYVEQDGSLSLDKEKVLNHFKK